MKSKRNEMRAKALSILKDKEYIHADMLAEKLNMSKSGVFLLIRKFRTDGVGIHTTPKGYVLSEFAKKIDDVHFMRRLNGRRASDYIALAAAEPEIRRRWSSVEDRRNLKLITGPIRVELNTVINAGKILLKTKKDLEGPVLKTKGKI